MKQYLSVLFAGSVLTTLLLVLSPISAYAQEASEESEIPVTEAASAETEAAAEEERPKSEVFLPSEEISEDFAVSFPVDI